jgi:colanic acid biosynthesis glycosyl transferase WcaI
MTDPPFEGIVGAFLAMLKNKPFVYNIRDLYPDMAVGGAIVQPGWLADIWEKLHRWALRRAATVVVLGDDMRNRILSKSVGADRVVVVRDGAEIPPARNAAEELDQSVVQAIRGPFEFVLLHAGNLGFYGAWDTLLEGARALNNSGVGLVFVGDGTQREKLESAAAGISNVRFLPFFPASKIPSVLAAADAHVITIKRGLEGVVVPSKMFGILAAAKPIVAVAPEQCDVVSIGHQKGFSIAADPDDPAQFVERVREIMSQPDRRRAMSEAAAAVAPEYESSAELRRLVALVECAAGPPKIRKRK